MLKFATAYEFRAQRRPTATINEEPSLTQQSDAAETDINIIVERFTRTGMLPNITAQALSGDFTEVGDYTTAQERILAANEAFSQIPAKLRERFDNDPAKFIAFASNPDNIDEMVELGLANAPPTPTQSTPNNAQTRATVEYDDNGTRTRTAGTEQPAGTTGLDPGQGSSRSPGEGRTAGGGTEAARPAPAGRPRQ